METTDVDIRTAARNSRAKAITEDGASIQAIDAHMGEWHQRAQDAQTWQAREFALGLVDADAEAITAAIEPS